MIARPFALALTTLGLAGGAAFAHHGWGSYAAGKKFSPVEHLMWQNPHVPIHVTYQGATWEAVLAPPFRMEARGLSPALLKAGAPVQVEALMMRSNSVAASHSACDAGFRSASSSVTAGNRIKGQTSKGV